MGQCERSGAHLDDPSEQEREKRHVRLNSVALAALEVLRARGDGSGHVVRTADGERLHRSRYWFEKALATAKIEGFHWHDLRHRFASRLTMAGVTIRAVQEAMGYKSIAMTVRYSHLSPAYKQQAVDSLVSQPATKPSDTTTDTDTLGAESEHSK